MNVTVTATTDTGKTIFERTGPLPMNDNDLGQIAVDLKASVRKANKAAETLGAEEADKPDAKSRKA